MSAVPNPWSGRHPATLHFRPLFGFEHLPPHLAEVSKPFAQLVEGMLRRLPDGPELVAGLRRLLESKDCMVRQAVLTHEAGKQ